MSRYLLTTLSVAWLVAGCVSTAKPELASLTPGSDVAVVVAAPAQPVEVVTAPESLINFTPPPEGSRTTCRQMLRQASNNIVRRCMTQSKWRTYDRAQEEWARQTLRQMQGSAY
jgi:hypothetical protein